MSHNSLYYAIFVLTLESVCSRSLSGLDARLATAAKGPGVVANVPSIQSTLPIDFATSVKSTLPSIDSLDDDTGDGSEKLVHPRRVHKPHHPEAKHINKTSAPDKPGHLATSSGTCGPSQGSTVPLTYHNGAVVTSQVNVYMIYVGFSQNSTAASWLNYLVGNLGTSSWWRVITQYYSSSGSASGAIALSGATYLTVSAGYTVDLSSASGVLSVVQYAINNKLVANNISNGIYVVVPAQATNVNLGQMCTQFCGWHTAASNNLKFALVPQPGSFSSCGGCSGFHYAMTSSGTKSPSGDYTVDAMASVLVHELEETVTDPLPLSGWNAGSGGSENGDVCAACYSTTQVGSYAPTLPTTLYSNAYRAYNQLIGSGVPYILQLAYNPSYPANNSKQQVGCVPGLGVNTSAPATSPLDNSKGSKGLRSA
ncbi:hypothetical protein CEUSTIGMA_g6606.t1 [Chlamydomonas eustigma]|uniref:Uncharacterized protein n=1 Tax=Chlamydomonas eustigma TaxID=1157962 RepID=A0A250X7Y1_9CHLO|nr:hypothetical protein CEUSTIGMA_g6606.t1 [Chlamydomonas eustigma]|eukprot:GAX79166.1 hypothetical protein CEUSTIGMA_g6606.t1 [Chlamydomonas eustigma]